MKEELFGRLWADDHDRASADFTRRLQRFGTSEGDPLPLVARAMALVLAVSLTTLTLGVTSA